MRQFTSKPQGDRIIIIIIIIILDIERAWKQALFLYTKKERQVKL